MAKLSFDIVHIFTSEGLYQNRFIKFAEENFDLNTNLFVFRRKDRKFSFLSEESTQIIYIKNLFSFIIKLLPVLTRSRKIVIHYLPLGPSLIFWYIFGFLLSKTTWILWGSDLYFYKDHKNNIKDNIYEFLRKRIIRKIPYIACFIRGDYELAKKIYKTRAEYQYICYPLPTDFSLLEKIRHSEITQPVKRILIGNSAARTNNHIDILNKISFLARDNVEIICPLSYGDDKTYVQEVISSGKSIFGEKFTPFLEVLPVQEYSRFLLTINAAIMNHERQQGLGNILSLLFLGKKVFLRDNTTSYEYFKSLNMKIFSIEDIPVNNYKNFFEFQEEYKEKNYQIIKNEFSIENYKKMWKPVFTLYSEL